MTRQRKTHLFILALVPIVVFTAVRCADSPTTAPEVVAEAQSSEARLANLHAENDWVGAYHNDALAYVFANLRRAPAKGRDRRSVCETARKAYAEFHRSRRGPAVPASVDADFARFCASGSATSAFRAASLVTPGGPSRTEVSANAQALMDQVEGAIDASSSYEDLSARINSIEATAASTLSYDEASGVFAVGSIALSSADYWANNIPAWIPFTSTADYSVLLSTMTSGFDNASPVFGGLSDGSSSTSGGWSDFANKVWRDAKAAAKRAAGGDVKAAVKVIVAAGVAGSAIVYEVVISGAAVGSIIAVLQM